MTDTQVKSSNASQSNMKFHVIYVSIIVVLLLVIAGGVYYVHKQREKMTAAMMMMASNSKAPGQGMKMNMAPASPPPLTAEQTQQLATSSSTTSTQKTFNITGGNFYFVPNKITVNKGDTVTFILEDAGGVHDLYIDEMNVKTPVIQTGKTATVTFTADKVGSFVYYCSIPGHREKGMWGTLVVQ